MERKELKVYLYCNHCAGETLHEIHYINDMIDKINCVTCNTTSQKSDSEIQNLLLGELMTRIASKPERIRNELKDSFWEFTISISLRVVTKPYRFTKEIIKMIEEVKMHKS